MKHTVTFDNGGMAEIADFCCCEYAQIFARTHGFLLGQGKRKTFLPGTVRDSRGKIVDDKSFPPVTWWE